MHNRIPTYVINLKHRTDRKAHIVKEFHDRSEFSVHIQEACEHESGAVGLWQSICRIITSAENDGLDFVLLCEDDHQFTGEYTSQYLSDSIAECQQRDGDLLLGAISWFDSALPVSENLHWVGSFTGTQFMVIFKKFYQEILKAAFTDIDNADYKLAALTSQKFFMSRPVSTQVYFGYSDITARNGLEGRLEGLFERSARGIDILKKVSDYYQKEVEVSGNEVEDADLEKLMIPVYAIPGSDEDRLHIARQFAGRPEFELNFIAAEDAETKMNVSNWIGLRRIAQQAEVSDEDVIIICNNDHSFTSNYNKKDFLKQIIEAHYQGADLLLAGCQKFHRAFPVGPSRYWIAEAEACSFLVVYRKFFEALLAEPFDEDVKPGKLIHKITFDKMLLYPFISHSLEAETLTDKATKKLKEVENATLKYFWKNN